MSWPTRATRATGAATHSTGLGTSVCRSASSDQTADLIAAARQTCADAGLPWFPHADPYPEGDDYGQDQAEPAGAGQ